MMKHAICIALLLAFPLSSALAADSYTLDPRHTYPRWAAGHLGFSTHHGQFNRTSGKLKLDAKGGTGSVEVTVDAASVSTGDPKFDAHLKSADFFEVEKHPTITFKSTSMKFEGGKPVSASGDFTMLGITRPLTFSVAAFHCGPHPVAKRDVCGADLTATVRRSAHGMKYGIPGISDDIRLAIQVEAIKD